MACSHRDSSSPQWASSAVGRAALYIRLYAFSSNLIISANKSQSNCLETSRFHPVLQSFSCKNMHPSRQRNTGDKRTCLLFFSSFLFYFSLILSVSLLSNFIPNHLYMTYPRASSWEIQQASFTRSAATGALPHSSSFRRLKNILFKIKQEKVRIADTETNYIKNSLAGMNEFKGKEKIKFHFARGEPKDDFLLLFFPLFFFFFYQAFDVIFVYKWNTYSVVIFWRRGWHRWQVANQKIK